MCDRSSPFWVRVTVRAQGAPAMGSPLFVSRGNLRFPLLRGAQRPYDEVAKSALVRAGFAPLTPSLWRRAMWSEVVARQVTARRSRAYRQRRLRLAPLFVSEPTCGCLYFGSLNGPMTS